MRSKSSQSKSAKQKHQTPQRDPNQMEVSGTTFNRKQIDPEYGQQLAEDSQYLPKTIPGFQLPCQNLPNHQKSQDQPQKTDIETLNNCLGEPQKNAKNNLFLSLLRCNFFKGICGQNSCINQETFGCQWFTKLDKKKKAAIIIPSVFLTLAVLSIAIYFIVISSGPRPTDQMELSALEHNRTILFVNSMRGTTKNNHTYSAYMTNRKIQVPHLTLGSVLKMVVNSDKAEQIHFNIPIQSILQTFSVQHKQQKAYANWLEDYNNNPQETVEKLVQTIKQSLSKRGSYKFGKMIADNLTVVSISQRSQIEVEYLPFEQKFGAARLGPDPEDESKAVSAQNRETIVNKVNPQNNLKSQVIKQESQSVKNTESEKNVINSVEPVQTTKNDKQIESDLKSIVQNYPVPDEALMRKVMLQTIYYIKRVVARNIEVLRQKKQELESFQNKILDDSAIEQEWQKVLEEECRTLHSLRFRCSLEGAIKIVPGLTLENIYSDRDLIISETLSLVFKETEKEE